MFYAESSLTPPTVQDATHVVLSLMERVLQHGTKYEYYLDYYCCCTVTEALQVLVSQLRRELHVGIKLLRECPL